MKRLTKNVLSLFVSILFSATTMSAAGLYTCGGFNHWDVKNCLSFEQSATDANVYSLTLDFSQNGNFKISTVNPAQYPEMDPWVAFDSGALQTIGSPKEGELCMLETGLNNIESPVQGLVRVTVDLGAMTIMFGDGKPVTAWSGTLPLMVINTEGNRPIVSKEEYLTATYYIDNMGTEFPSIGSADEPLVTQIKGRGNWTWTGFDKKPYRLKLDKKQPLLGMESSKHFCLLAHADDNRGFLRNPVAFRLSEMLDMPWTPAQQPVEVVLNGEYIGLYFLTETVRVDKKRVNVTEQKDLVTDPELVTGGWLVEIDNYDTDPHVTVPEGGDNNYDIWFTYKTPEILSSEQDLYLSQQMSLLNDLIYGNTDSYELWNHIDMDQLARYYIVQEIVDNYESFHGSCYLYKQLGQDEAWHFGPVWDFGSALWGHKEQFIYEGRPHHQVWIGQICRFPAFMNAVKKIWLKFNGEQFDQIYTYVDNFAKRIATATQYDARRWPNYGNANEMEMAEQVKRFLSDSRAWLGHQWGVPDALDLPQNDNALTVVPGIGCVTVISEVDCNVSITSISGMCQNVAISAGTNYISLPAGFYIVESTKVAVK